MILWTKQHAAFKKLKTGYKSVPWYKRLWLWCLSYRFAAALSQMMKYANLTERSIDDDQLEAWYAAISSVSSANRIRFSFIFELVNQLKQALLISASAEFVEPSASVIDLNDLELAFDPEPKKFPEYYNFCNYMRVLPGSKSTTLQLEQYRYSRYKNYSYSNQNASKRSKDVILCVSKFLPFTKLCVLNLAGHNFAGDKLGDVRTISALAKALPLTRIHTLNLSSTKLASNLDSTELGLESISILFESLARSYVTALDLSDNKLGDAGLRALTPWLRKTKIKTLNLNHICNEDVFTFKTIDIFIANLEYTGVVRLAFKKNNIDVACLFSLASGFARTNIQELDIAQNQRVELQRPIKIIPILPCFSKALKVLILRNCYIYNRNLKILASCLKDLHLISLDLSDNFIDKGAGIKALCQHLKPTLHNLHLSANSLSDEGIQMLIPYLCQAHNLRTLDLSHNHMTAKCLIRLADAIQKTNIETLVLSIDYFSLNRATHIHFKYFFTCLNKRTKVQALSFRRSNLNASCLRSMALGLKNTNITTLDLSDCKLNDKEIEPLMANLRETEVKTLILSGNELTDASVERLWRGIISSEVKHLNLCGNKISGNGAKSLIRRLKHTLYALNLSDNNMTIEDQKDAIRALAHGKITIIDLSRYLRVDPDPETMEALAQEIITGKFAPNTTIICNIYADKQRKFVKAQLANDQSFRPIEQLFQHVLSRMERDFKANVKIPLDEYFKALSALFPKEDANWKPEYYYIRRYIFPRRFIFPKHVARWEKSGYLYQAKELSSWITNHYFSQLKHEYEYLWQAKSQKRSWLLQVGFYKQLQNCYGDDRNDRDHSSKLYFSEALERSPMGRTSSSG